MGKTSIPRKDADFNVAQNTIVTTTNQNRVAWGVDANLLDNIILPEKMAWEAAWEAYVNPNTRTPLITAAKTEKRKKYEPDLRILVKSLQSNIRVTDDELRSMGIVVPSSSKIPAPIAKKAPDTDVDTSTIGRVTIHFFEMEGNHKRGKPDGQHGVEIAWMQSDVPPARWEDFTHSAVDTRSPHTFVFENDQRGKTIYFALRWENTRGEKGPWSEIKSAIIP